jgi:4-oxalocrotonate tautomerase
MATLHYGEESVSVAMEEVKAADWTEKVYKPDILAKHDTLYKEPRYEPRVSDRFFIGRRWPLHRDGAAH